MLNLKRKYKIILACSVLLSLFFLSSWSLLGSMCYILKPNLLVSPKTSSNEISIITPEDKTYTAPMSGYYPATFGFENDDDGSDPEDWILNENPPNYEIEVVSEKQGHKKVVHLYDNENAWRSMNHYPDGNPTTGTIELWVFGVDVTDYRFNIGLWDTTLRRGFAVIMADDKWQYWDASYHDISNVGIPQDNTWHHLRIDFRCAGAPSYQGLSMASYKVIVDGIESGEISFWEAANHLERLSIGTDAAPNSEWWLDAISFSWDPNYNIGDNLDEGLLLSFESTITLDWIGYSLDGQTTKTILGDTTIPMPEGGAHNIQVFGNDSLGTMYTSDLRHFTLAFPINIITPESKTYTAPMAGYYHGTYGFESDNDNSMPRDWDKIKPNGGNADAYVVSSAYGHNKVIRLYDPWQFWYPTYVQVKNSFAEQFEGTIDFYLYYTKLVYINLLHDTTEVIKIRFGALGLISYWKNGQWIMIDSLPGLIANQWYHCQIYFDSYWNLWRLTINDNSMPSLEFSNGDGGIGDSIKAFMISTDPATSSYNTYIDAVGYSWDPYYDIEDNKYEGLFLEFNPDDLYYMSYTLDGVSRTIYGDTVFPMPKSGAHTISVYGTDQNGSDYWGERSFSVQYEEWFGIFMWASDAADGEDAEPPFVFDEAVEGNMHQYRDILYDKGFRKFYFYRDVDDGDEYDAIMDRLEKRIDINDQVFFYIRGHGNIHGVYISPQSLGGYILEVNDFEDDIDEFESIYKGVLVEACESGNWADKLNKKPYVAALSSSAVGEYSEVDPISHQGFFSLHFFAGVQMYGKNAQEAFYYAKDQFDYPWISQTPQGFFNPPDEDPYFMFFD